MNQELPKNLTNELAKERNRAAAERTLMAWIRTCLSLISFGFGIDRVTASINKSSQQIQVINPWRPSRLVGIAFIILGTVSILGAILEHRKILELIERDDYVYMHRRSLSLSVAVALSFIGLGILIILLFFGLD